MRGSVRLPDNDVGMKLRIALVVVSDVAHERHQFDLLLNLDLLVVVFRQIEESQCDALKGSDSGEMGAG
jgi:hypothetical protein